MGMDQMFLLASVSLFFQINTASKTGIQAKMQALKASGRIEI
jgi:hypothetical protein